MKHSIKKTMGIILKNKLLILLLVLIQISFFGAIAATFFFTGIPALEQAKKAVEYYDKINITEDSDMFAYLGEEPMIIVQSYARMQHYLKVMAYIGIPLYILLTAFIWGLSYYAVFKKRFFANLLKSIILISSFTFILYALFFERIKEGIAALEVSMLSGPIFIIFFMVYFLMISLSSDSRRLKVKLITGIKKSYILVPVCLSCIAAISLFAYLAYLVLELNILVMFAMILLFIVSIVILRIFFIVCVEDIR